MAEDRSVVKAKKPRGSAAQALVAFIIVYISSFAWTEGWCCGAFIPAIAALVAAILVARTGIRHQISRISVWGRVLGACAVIFGIAILAERAFLPGYLYQGIFGVTPSSDVRFVRTQQWGIIDKEELLVFDCLPATAEDLIKKLDLKPNTEAEELRASLQGSSPVPADAAMKFHYIAAPGLPMFFQHLPFEAGLRVYQNARSADVRESTRIHLLWNPRTSRVHVMRATP